jgi:hypothetical protein
MMRKIIGVTFLVLANLASIPSSQAADESACRNDLVKCIVGASTEARQKVCDDKYLQCAGNISRDQMPPRFRPCDSDSTPLEKASGACGR